MKDIIIRTERLIIMPQTMVELSERHRIEPDAEMKQAYGEMLEAMRQLPGQEEWGTEWKIQLPDGTVIGGIGFKGAPDEEGTVEIGYGIQEAYRKKGYASEAVGGLLSWAAGQKGVRCVTAQTEPGNLVSQMVLLNNGFVRDGFGAEGPLYQYKVS